MNKQVVAIALAAFLFTTALGNGILSAQDEDPEFTYVIQDGVFGATDDASLSVDSNLAKHNLGGMQTIDLWQHGGTTLIRFDLTSIPEEAAIKSASLELFSYSVGFAEEEVARDWPINVSEFRHAWVEGTGTNQTAEQSGTTLSTSDGNQPWPDGNAMKSVGKLLATTHHQGGESRWYEWQLDAEVVNKWLTNPDSNHGMIVWGEAPGKAISFASSEFATVDNRPKLRLTTSIPVKKMIESALGAGEVRPGVKRVKEVATYINPENDRITVNVDWSLRTPNFSKREGLEFAKLDVRRLLGVAAKLGPALSHIDIRGYAELVDKFGKTDEALVINAYFAGDTVAKINWKNFAIDNVLKIADSYALHPELEKLNK